MGRFRIYRFGSLEVRTIQAHNSEETVGAVFSVRAPKGTMVGKKDRCVDDDEKMVKATEYVERADEGTVTNHHYYVVLETAKGNVIVTEKLRDGTVTWNENPRDLEDRTSLARVL